MASPPRALFPLLVALAACGTKPAPPDPAVAAATGIPMGAPKATGVDFEAPPTRASVSEFSRPAEGPIPLPKALPSDPFAPMEPAEPQGPAEAPEDAKGSKPAMKGMQL